MAGRTYAHPFCERGAYRGEQRGVRRGLRGYNAWRSINPELYTTKTSLKHRAGDAFSDRGCNHRRSGSDKKRFNGIRNGTGGLFSTPRRCNRQAAGVATRRTVMDGTAAPILTTIPSSFAVFYAFSSSPPIFCLSVAASPS